MQRSRAALAAVLIPLLAVGLGFTILNPDPRLQIILDVSGSMAGEAGGQPKIEAAKDAIVATLDALDEGTLVPGESERPYFLTALRLYGHNLPREPKAASCEDTELVIPFQPLDRGRFLDVLEGAIPSGQTPLARSLREAANDFGEIGEDPAVVILVSDGEETCGGDPVAAACELEEQGFDLTVHTVGFDVGSEARGQLEGVAECTGGEYRDAGNADELGESLRELTTASLLIEKRSTTRGTPIRGGDGFQDAVPLEPGTLYRLDHHQREDEFDYFSVDVASGQKIVATIHTGPLGVSISGDSYSETDLPYAGIEVHGPDESEIASEQIIGDSNDSESLQVGVHEGGEGRFYVLVGSSYADQHMDSPFQVEVVDQFDAGGGRDAGSDDRSAVTIEPGEHTGWFQFGDVHDYYRFSARAGETFELRARPVHREVLVHMDLYDADGAQLVRADAPNRGAAVTIDEFSVEEDGDFFIDLEDFYGPNSPETEYELELTVVAGERAGREDAEEADEEADVEESAGEDGDEDDGGFPPVLLVLGMVVVIAALVGGIMLGRRTS